MQQPHQDGLPTSVSVDILALKPSVELNIDVLREIFRFLPFKVSLRASLVSKELGERILSWISVISLPSSMKQLARFNPELLTGLEVLQCDLGALSGLGADGKRKPTKLRPSRKPNFLLEAAGRMSSLRKLHLSGEISYGSFASFVDAAFGSSDNPGKLKHLENLNAWNLLITRPGPSTPKMSLQQVLEGISATCPSMKDLYFPSIGTFKRTSNDYAIATRLTKLERLYLHVERPDSAIDPTVFSPLKSLKELQVTESGKYTGTTVELFLRPDEPYIFPSGKLHRYSWRHALDHLEAYQDSKVDSLRRDTLLQILTRLFDATLEGLRESDILQILQVLTHPIVVKSAATLSTADDAVQREMSFLEAVHACAPQMMTLEAAKLFIAPFVKGKTLPSGYYSALDAFITSMVGLTFADQAPELPLLDALIAVSPSGVIPNRLLFAQFVRIESFQRAEDVFRQMKADPMELGLFAQQDFICHNDLHDVLLNFTRGSAVHPSGQPLLNDLIHTYGPLIKSDKILLAYSFNQACRSQNWDFVRILLSTLDSCVVTNVEFDAVQSLLLACEEVSDIQMVLTAVSDLAQLRVPVLPDRADLTLHCLKMGLRVDDVVLASATAPGVTVSLFSELWRAFNGEGKQIPELMKSAVTNGNLDVLRFLVDAGGDLKHVYEESRSLLFFLPNAASSKEVVAWLVSKGVDLEIRDTSGNTALLHAASFDQQQAVLGLIEAGADPSVRTATGFTIFTLPNGLIKFFCQKTHGKSILQRFDLDVLSKCGPSGEHLLLHLARNAFALENNLFHALRARDDWNFFDKQADSGEALLVAVCSIERQAYRIVVDWIVAEAKHLAPAMLSPAASLRKHESVELHPFSRILRVIRKLDKPDYQNTSLSSEGRTATHAACACYDVGSIFALLEVTTDLSLTDNGGNTPLCLLIPRLHNAPLQHSAVSLLISKSAQQDRAILDKKNHAGDNPLFFAARFNQAFTSSELIAAGASLTNLGSNNMHLIHTIAKFDSKDVLQMLINKDVAQAKTMLTLCDRDGLLPLETACTYGSMKTAEIMLQHGANPNPTSNRKLQFTCLGIVAQINPESRAEGFVKLLLKYGADPAALDGRGRTAAEVCGYPELSQYLKSLADGEITFSAETKPLFPMQSLFFAPNPPAAASPLSHTQSSTKPAFRFSVTPDFALISSSFEASPTIETKPQPPNPTFPTPDPTKPAAFSFSFTPDFASSAAFPPSAPIQTNPPASEAALPIAISTSTAAAPSPNQFAFPTSFNFSFTHGSK